MKIKSLIISIIAGCLASLMAACSSSDTFKIKGSIVGNPNMNISITYYADDAVRSLVTVARKGAFEAECPTTMSTLVTLTDGNDRPLGMFYANPGDKITCTVDRNNPYKITVTGNTFNLRWSQVADSLSDVLLNGSSEEINTAIENFIATYPADEVSALLLSQCYDASVSPTRTLSLLDKIAPEAQNSVFLDGLITQLHAYADSASLAPIHEIVLRTSTDSAYHFKTKEKPLNFIAISGNRNDWRHDSVRLALRRQYANPRVQVLSLSVATDTIVWKRIVRQDSAQCIQAWAPGGELAPQISRLAIPTLPFFIITDSAGTQLMRTPSLATAEDFIKSKN